MSASTTRSQNAPTQEQKEQLIHERWYQDTENLKAEIEGLPNVGYYLPRYRALNESHCTTIVDFEHGDIQEDGLVMSDFIRNVLDGTGPVMEASEEDTVADFQKLPNPVYIAIDALLRVGDLADGSASLSRGLAARVHLAAQLAESLAQVVLAREPAGISRSAITSRTIASSPLR